jgi:hypothetical protein
MTAVATFNKFYTLPWFWPSVAGLAVLALLTAWWSSPRMKGWRGEWWVRVYLRRLDAKAYHCLHDLLIPDGAGGLTQIDHVVVSPFGIFVIETKNFSGWIFGSEKEAQWNVNYGRGSKRTIPNPLKQNFGHVCAVESLLGLPKVQCHNVVFLAGNAEFKKAPVPGVVQRRLDRHIKEFQTPVWNGEMTASLAKRLSDASLSHDRQARAAHLAQVRTRKSRVK